MVRGSGCRNWKSVGGASGMLITGGFSMGAGSVGVFCGENHQAVRFQYVHFSVCILYSNKNKLRMFACQMVIHYYGET